MINLGKRANPADTHIGQRLKTLRLAGGFSQTDIANALGVTFQQVQKYENSTNRISAGRLRDIALFLDVSIDAFYKDLPTPGAANIPAAVLQNAATRDGVRVLTALGKMSDAHRRNVVILVENIAELLGK